MTINLVTIKMIAITSHFYSQFLYDYSIIILCRAILIIKIKNFSLSEHAYILKFKRLNLKYISSQ